MDGKTSILLLVSVFSVFAEAWRTSQEERQQVVNMRSRGVHYHSKRHMMPPEDERQDIRTDASKRRIASPRNRKKPTGHLKPLNEDDMDNDEVVSVAIGPPPMRPKYDKINWRHSTKMTTTTPSPEGHNCTHGATNLVQNVLTQLGREFLTHQVSEDFVFGQYIGNAMRNITSDLKLKMQHEILEIIVRYQKLSRGEVLPTLAVPSTHPEERITIKGDFRPVAKEMIPRLGNDTEESWPDFTNLAKIVG